MKLHLGSGNVRLEGWLNIDLDAPAADMHIDLTGPLPFEDASVAYIFCEHFIEHIDRGSALKLLRECRRVLKENGVIRLSTPNLAHIVVSYLSRNTNEWGEVWQPSNPCHLMNEAMRSWGHAFLYDAEELVYIITEAGFQSLRFVQWRESTVESLVGLESRPFHNELILEAFKQRTADSTWLDKANETIVKQATRIHELESALLAQELNNEGFQKDIMACVAQIKNLEIDWQARGQRIEELEAAVRGFVPHIEQLETEIARLRLSWRIRIRSALQKLLQR